jgi:hypothetical protein
MAVVTDRNIEPNGWSDVGIMELRDSDFERPCFCFLCQACIPRQVHRRNSGHCPSCRRYGVAIVWALMVLGTAANALVIAYVGFS